MNSLFSRVTFVSLAMMAGGAGAQSITPANYAATINVGQTISINKSITLAAGGATKVDVLFLADNTGSMGGVVSNAQSGATSIMTNLAASGNYNFGVANYFGDPIEGVPAATAFNNITPMTSNTATVQSGINSWTASGGGDTPEANYFALKQAATTTTWRSDAQRLVVWFGDAPSHTETTTRTEAVAALTGASAKVVAFNSGGAGGGIDGAYGTDGSQASQLVAATGGSLTNNFTSLGGAAFVAAVTDQITAAASTVNLTFGSTLAGSGLTLSFTCTDVLGCTNVAGGATRTFDLSITGVLPGTYAFDVYAQGVDAFEHDVITVSSGTTPVPEPETYALAAAGLLVLGALKRQRRAAA